MQAIIQPFSAARRCPACFALGGASVVGAGTALWYGGTKALVVGAVALAAIALIAVAYKAISGWKQRPVEPTEFVDYSSTRGIIHWEMKLRNVVVVIQERAMDDGLYSRVTSALISKQRLDGQTTQSLKTILSSKEKAFREEEACLAEPFRVKKEGDPRRLVLPVAFNGRANGERLRAGIQLALSAATAFVAEGDDADKITILFQNPNGVKLKPDFLGL